MAEPDDFPHSVVHNAIRKQYLRAVAAGETSAVIALTDLAGDLGIVILTQEMNDAWEGKQ